MGNKNTQALAGTLDAPAAYGGSNAPITQPFEEPSVATTKATNKNSVKGTATASPDAKSTLNYAIVLVVGALVLLWMLGGIVFKNANL